MLRRAVLVIPIALLALLGTGCDSSRSNIEKSIRDEMKSQMGVVITSFDLKKQGNGGYAGTATAQNGDVYDVTTSPPNNNRIEWKAIPGQAMVEKLLHTGIEQQLGAKVKSLQITKTEPGNYTGSAELETGFKVTVTTRMEGKNLLWEAKPVAP